MRRCAGPSEDRALGRGEGAGGWRQLLTHMRLPLCMCSRPWPCWPRRGSCWLRATLLRNAREAATAFSRSCAAEEQGSRNVYETLLTFGTSALEERLEDGERAGSRSWPFWICTSRGWIPCWETGWWTPYVVLDGEILSARPWGGGRLLRLHLRPPGMSRPWRQEARWRSPRCTPTPSMTGRWSPPPRAAGTERWSWAFDILPEHLRFDTADLTEEDSFFLCEGSGTLIYQETGVELPREELQDYLTWLVAQIRSGELEDDPVIRDLNGQSRGVYYTRMDNSWYCIVHGALCQAPGRAAEPDLAAAADVRGLAPGTGSPVLAGECASPPASGGPMRRPACWGTGTTPLYRVDYERETYQMIKGSDYVRDRPPARGAVQRPAADRRRGHRGGRLSGLHRELLLREHPSAGAAEGVGNSAVSSSAGSGRSTAGSVCGCSLTSPWPGGEVVLCFREVEREKQRQLREFRLLQDALALARQNEASKQTFFPAICPTTCARPSTPSSA